MSSGCPSLKYVLWFQIKRGEIDAKGSDTSDVLHIDLSNFNTYEKQMAKDVFLYKRTHNRTL